MRHEVHLTLRGMRALVPVGFVLAGAGALIAGRAGALSALLGVGLVAANQIAAAVSTGWSRTVTPNTLAVGYAMFVVRMFAMFAAFAVLTQVPWVHRSALAAAFCAGLVAALGAECWSYARGTYVPRWRMAAIDDFSAREARLS